MVAVSICMPIYNVEKYLDQCLESIIQQTFRDFEVIMVDNGSTDDSFNICQMYALKDERFKLYRQEKAGVAAVRNTCLKHIHGEYVAWIDSDDWIDNDYLEKLVETQKKTQADIICIGNKTYMNDQIYLGSHQNKYGSYPGCEIPKKDAIGDIFFGMLSLISLWGCLIKKSLYRGFIFSEDNRYDDQGNKFKLYLQANKIVGIPEVAYTYRVREESITQSDTELLKFLEEQTANLEKLFYYVEVADFETDYFYHRYLEWLTRKLSEEAVKNDSKCQSYLKKRLKLLKSRMI
ncbi:glycosyltransferase family 2 protein [Ligilactobacillus salivarius]|uniref:glycosyltransferase family 2 protein n=1 Tax=Ligilactobacillus salivarius TaxID=1624 RepID=UPI00195D7186|nr:glycosyltransferase family 2 protein [Ligilactobacillus salivarius]MBM6956535.1 glycosyltransferase family 2 protein [Ligilactobacillus salivarius]